MIRTPGGSSGARRLVPASVGPFRLLLVLTLLGGRLIGGEVPERPAPPPPAPRDTFSDTWVATDALGRRLPTHADVGSPRADRYVGIFYFLWLGAHVRGGPWDVSEILRRDPDAMGKPDSPLWGPLHAPHHWGKPRFGYYLSDDPYVLRKHAQLLADARVDTVIFDVTNQITYRRQYLALLEVFSRVRQEGGQTPRVAFLCPFWDPAAVVAELYRDLYRPEIYPELWFRWEGKPLILADPERLEVTPSWSDFRQPVALEPGHTLGQSFTAEAPFRAVSGRFPTWFARDCAATLTLHRRGPGGERLAARRFENITDNAWLSLPLRTPRPPGAYYLEMSRPRGKVGWWSHREDRIGGGTAYADGKPCGGDRALQVLAAGEPSDEIRGFFTFRKPQPDYFRGPTGPDQWSWLEVYPQHVFKNSRGEKEQMSVGVAQNAVGGRLGSMSEPGARGRSFHARAAKRRATPVRWGLNFAEQLERALAEDPKFIFITGWNEWIASRFDEFAGVRRPVMFVDEFDQEHSRDIEPMQGGHGDDYYYQLVAAIRRFKGARPVAPASAPQSIDLGGGFAQWRDVTPEFRDDAGDTAHRDHPGFNDCARYVERSGRNDFIASKVARDARQVYFYARTRAPVTRPEGPEWMVLLIDVDPDHEPRTGWEGYDFAVRRAGPGSSRSALERWAPGGGWRSVREVRVVAEGCELHLAIPRSAIGLPEETTAASLDFKWTDNMPPSGTALDFIDHGDAAPNGRFNYRYAAER